MTNQRNRFRVFMGKRRDDSGIQARSNASRRSAHAARPLGEALESRTLLSISLDPTFGIGGASGLSVPPTTTGSSYNESISNIAEQNGQVVEVGFLTTTVFEETANPVVNIFVSRLQTTGTVDTSFGSQGLTVIPVAINGGSYYADNALNAAVAVQANGTIDIAAAVYTVGSDPSVSDKLMIAQFTANGTLDTSFGNSGTEIVTFGAPYSLQDYSPSGSPPLSIAIGPDGKIVVATTLYSSTTGTSDFGVARFNTNGTLDTTFNTTGYTTVSFPTDGSIPTNDIAYGVVVQPNDSIVVVGQAYLTSLNTTSDQAIVRLTPSGALDTTFNSTGELYFSYNNQGASTDAANAVAMDGSQIVIAGTSTAYIVPTGTGYIPGIANLTVTRLNSTGMPDTTFNGTGAFLLPLSQGGITFNTTADAITTLGDGSILIGGNATEQSTGIYQANADVALVKLTAAGMLDSTFGTAGVALLPLGGTLGNSLMVQPDAKIIFEDSGDVFRTTPPTLAVASTSITTTGTSTGTNAKATAVTIVFNTAINPILAKNIKVYVLRAGKTKKLVKIKSVSLDSTGERLTLHFAKTPVGKGFQVVIVPGGIVAADGNVLFGGASTPIVISS